MRRITKGAAPPCLTRIQADPGRTTWSLYGDESAEIRDALCRDQGSLCAYCQSRIRPDRASMKIEHWAARHDRSELVFEWGNLLGVCLGEQGNVQGNRLEDRFHCDAYRGNLSSTQ